jgi:small GTP-binding protein
MLRVMMVGNSRVGKTHIFNKLSRGGTVCTESCDSSIIDNVSIDNVSMDNILIHPQPTMGINVQIVKHYTTQNRNQYINVMIMDTSGLDQFRTINLQYLYGTHACVVVFDIGCVSSFIGAQRWIQTIHNHVDGTHDGVAILLIGNRLTDNPTAITQDDIDTFLMHYSVKYIELDCNGTDVDMQWFSEFVTDALQQDFINSCLIPVSPTAPAVPADKFRDNQGGIGIVRFITDNILSR